MKTSSTTSTSSVFRYYAVSLSLALLNTVLLISIFQLRTADQIIGVTRGHVAIPMESPPVTPMEELEKQLELPPTPESVRREDVERMELQTMYQDAGTADKMKRMFRTPLVHCFAFYSALYVGAEITIGGWAVSLFPLFCGIN